MRESIQVFIAPPDPAVLRERLDARGTDAPEAIDARLEVAEGEMAAQHEFAHSIVNDDLDRAADELERVVRTELGLSLDSPAND
jgi:guanylate kinase